MSQEILTALYCLQAIAATAFSIFMMYSMYKTKKAAEKIVENAKELNTNFQTAINTVLPTIIGGQAQQHKTEILPFKQHNTKMSLEDAVREVNNTNPYYLEPEFEAEPINLTRSNTLVKKFNGTENRTEFIYSNCCNALIKYSDKTDQLTCKQCDREVNTKGEVLK